MTIPLAQNEKLCARDKKQKNPLWKKRDAAAIAKTRKAIAWGGLPDSPRKAKRWKWHLVLACDTIAPS